MKLITDTVWAARVPVGAPPGMVGQVQYLWRAQAACSLLGIAVVPVTAKLCELRVGTGVLRGEALRDVGPCAFPIAAGEHVSATFELPPGSHHSAAVFFALVGDDWPPTWDEQRAEAVAHLMAAEQALSRLDSVPDLPSLLDLVKLEHHVQQALRALGRVELVRAQP